MPHTRATSSVAVRLTLFADLRRLLPNGHDGPLTITLPPGSTVADLMAAASVPPEEDVTIGINGDQGARDSVLADGDDVVFFSPMEGG
ncbi:MAG: MoaD/ThiS family protein [Chloroflexi bacterium]|nr:MoaD/ThiS family protein [Chloroflexota bacterium]PWB69313.1 MAG: molybdopterin synthase sulfur carrier subunit [Holophagae bacterium]